MDRGPAGSVRHARGRDLSGFAAIALALLAFLALPLAVADPSPGPLADTEGPAITGGAVAPSPVVPDFVTVTARATDNASLLASAEFFVDMPGIDGSSFFRMRPMDNLWNALAEDLTWFGGYDTFSLGQAPGPHVLYVHAMDALGNWGPYEILPYHMGDPAVIGPGVASLAVTPGDLATGASLTIDAAIFDPFKGVIEAAEFFFDLPGPDGTGTPLEAADGAFDRATEVVTWTGVVSLPIGDHIAYVRGKSRGLWGAAVGAGFVARAPAFTLRITPDRDVVGPGELVAYSVAIENRGNADAAGVALDVVLPAAMTYRDDTVADANGTRVVGTTYAFGDVPPGARTFTIRAEVVGGATDGTPLDASASLDFTNDQGWDFPAVTAGASGTVVAPEVSLLVTGPSTGFAGEPATLSIQIVHSGARAIPLLDVSLAPSPWTSILFDTAAQAGATSLVPGSWRFANLDPGTYEFDVGEAIATSAPDGLSVSRTLDVSYTSRLGIPVSLADSVALSIARPIVAFEVVPERSVLRIGDRFDVDVDFTNAGTATSAFVQIEIALPSPLLLVGGDAPALSSGDRHTWIRTAVAPGAHRVTLRLEARAAGPLVLSFDLTYSSPDGTPLDRVVESAGIEVGTPPPSPTPLYLGASATGAAVAIGALLATERGKTAFLFLFLPLYTRLQREHILDHETRGMIRGYILANPGDHYNSIKEALELPNGTLAYHIQVLEKEMLVRSVKDGKFRRFYPYEMRMPEGGEPTKIQRVILDLIRTNPGITPRDAAALLGLTSSTVSYHLERLADLGRIEYRRDGISKRLFVKGDLGP